MYEKYFTMYLKPVLTHNLYKIRSKVYTRIAKLDAKYVWSKEPIPFDNKNDEPLKKIKKGQKWGNLYDCAWFNFTGKVPETAKGKKTVLIVNTDSEGCLFDNEGTPIKGLSVIGGIVDFFQPLKGKKVLEFCDNAIGGENIDIWVEAGHNKMTGNFKKYASFKEASIATFREDINSFYYDYLNLMFFLMTLKKDNKKYSSINASLAKSITLANDFSPENITKARECLRKEMDSGENSPYECYAVGHSHLDLAWLWPIRETKRKAGRTFSNTIFNIEKYPEYIYGVSQPQQLQWTKENYPKLFEKIKENISKDRIEVQGRMWVECDTNLPCGESLIRQSVYGNRFWTEEFGKTTKICWLPDVFGFSGNLPQILKKCGMDYFLTIKLSWNEHNKFPHRTFLWEGIDNSERLVHMPPEGNYNSDCTPISLEKGIRQYPEKIDIKEMAVLYGIGDGGGGPSEGHIECARRCQNMKNVPQVKMSPAINLFEKLNKKRELLTKYKGELYLEKHQGTFTTQAKTKLNNRKAEKLLHNVEFLSTVAHIKEGKKYPYEKLEEIWKEILLYQFHDIIPGSSINRVYDESNLRYEKIINELNNIQKEVTTGSEKDLYITNTTSYCRNEYMSFEDKNYLAVVKPYSSALLQETEKIEQDNSSMENEFLRIEFFENGEIKSLFLKESQKEFCGKYLNHLNVYKDKKKFYNAWDIDINYPKKHLGKFKILKSAQYTKGNSIIRENLCSFNKSTLTQKIILTKGNPYVEFENHIDWQETLRMLRAEFMPDVYSDEICCDIQMGNIKRSTKNDTSIEKAQFEICAHKWVDVSNDKFGISLLNDCKYGYRAKNGLISMNILRSTMYPAKDADKGNHIFKYALYPHKGNCYEANVAKWGYLFNNPLIIGNNNIGNIVETDNDHIVIETIKMAENRKEEIIIRIYEDSNNNITTSLKLNIPYKKAFEADMLENNVKEISLDEIEFSPFEIKTIKILL